MKQYKLVAGPTTNQFVGEKADNSAAVASFESIIAQYAAAGWTYHSMEPITSNWTETTGCLFTKQSIPHSTTFYMLVFVKEA